MADNNCEKFLSPIVTDASDSVSRSYHSSDKYKSPVGKTYDILINYVRDTCGVEQLNVSGNHALLFSLHFQFIEVLL